MRLSTGWLTTLPEDGLGHLGPGLERDGRVGQHPPDPLVGDDRTPQRRARLASASTAVVALGDLEGGLGVAPCGRVAAGHQAAPSVLRPADAGAAQELVDEPSLAIVGHRLADDACRRRAARGRRPRPGRRRSRGPSPPRSRRPRARASARAPRLRRGDVRVTRLLGDLLGAGQDVVRLATRLAERGDALGLRVLAILRACSASLRPCSIRDLRSASMADTGLNANDQMMMKKRMKLSALTITQNRLTWNSARFTLFRGELDDVSARARRRRPGCPPWTTPAG